MRFFAVYRELILSTNSADAKRLFFRHGWRVLKILTGVVGTEEFDRVALAREQLRSDEIWTVSISRRFRDFRPQLIGLAGKL